MKVPFTRKKYMVLCAHADIPKGILYHEYKHLSDHHIFRTLLLECTVPLLGYALYKNTVYPAIMSVCEDMHNPVLSFAGTLARIPAAWALYKASSFFSLCLLRYVSRLHEWKADDAIPAKYAIKAANFLERYKQYEQPYSIPVLSRFPRLQQWVEHICMCLLSEHPSLQERIEKLRARALV